MSLHQSPEMQARRSLEQQFADEWIVDPHSHTNQFEPAAKNPLDVLGYHYYTELVHSAGIPRAQTEEAGLPDDERFRRLFVNLPLIANTIQYSWLCEIVREHFGFHDPLEPGKWRDVYDAGVQKMQQPTWAQEVIDRSKLKAVFLTNNFDEELTGFDTAFYIPCLRTDDPVFHLNNPSVRARILKLTGIEVTSAATALDAVEKIFARFMAHGCRACAISIPPSFVPTQVLTADADKAIAELVSQGLGASSDAKRVAAQFVFWTLAEQCAAQNPALPFDLMIGVERRVYEGGVFQGQDLFDSRVSLFQYRELFNSFPTVTFPISVLASVTSQELMAYSWIFPNVVTNGHWWYSNTPTFIEHDAGARLEAVPEGKQIGYYSDMYCLEFALPKFAMYRRILAKILVERFMRDRGWSEEQALALGTKVLKTNSESIFRFTA